MGEIDAGGDVSGDVVPVGVVGWGGGVVAQCAAVVVESEVAADGAGPSHEVVGVGEGDLSFDGAQGDRLGDVVGVGGVGSEGAEVPGDPGVHDGPDGGEGLGVIAGMVGRVRDVGSCRTGIAFSDDLFGRVVHIEALCGLGLRVTMARPGGLICPVGASQSERWGLSGA